MSTCNLVSIALLAALLLSASSSRAAEAKADKTDLGQPAPQWLREAETYAFGPQDMADLARSKVSFITHVPISAELFRRYHALGIRVFPYVTLYMGVASYEYQGVALRVHPEYIEVDEHGNLNMSHFWVSEDAKNMYNICPNVKEYQDAMVAWVDKLMRMGADGIFLDNLGHRQPCHGPRFGKHKHIYNGDNSQDHAFAMLIKRVRETIKRHKPDGAILGNTSWPPNLPREIWKYVDCDMVESYICTWVSTERWQDWHGRWNAVGKQLQPIINGGKAIQALSYLGHTPYGIKEDAFYTYASARLSGFVWNGGIPVGNPEASILYSIRLGKPVTDELESNGVHYRLFEAGMVAVNPDRDKPAELAIDSRVPVKELIDLAAGVKCSKIQIPAYSGRVYLYDGPAKSEVDAKGPKLTIATSPEIGSARFRVDGFDFWTHSGRWTTEYVKGSAFGKFDIIFSKPGKHQVEIVDVVPQPMKTPAGYSVAERLGDLMDPADPTKPMHNKNYRFRGWSGAVTGTVPSVSVDVSTDVTLTAEFDVIHEK